MLVNRGFQQLHLFYLDLETTIIITYSSLSSLVPGRWKPERQRSHSQKKNWTVISLKACQAHCDHNALRTGLYDP